MRKAYTIATTPPTTSGVKNPVHGGPEQSLVTPTRHHFRQSPLVRQPYPGAQSVPSVSVHPEPTQHAPIPIPVPEVAQSVADPVWSAK